MTAQLIVLCDDDSEQTDTTSRNKLIFPTFGALAEFELGIIRERARAGLAAARARVRMGQAEEAGDADQGGDGEEHLCGPPPLDRRHLQERGHLARHALPLPRRTGDV